MFYQVLEAWRVILCTFRAVGYLVSTQPPGPAPRCLWGGPGKALEDQGIRILIAHLQRPAVFRHSHYLSISAFSDGQWGSSEVRGTWHPTMCSTTAFCSLRRFPVDPRLGFQTPIGETHIHGTLGESLLALCQVPCAAGAGMAAADGFHSWCGSLC